VISLFDYLHDFVYLCEEDFVSLIVVSCRMCHDDGLHLMSYGMVCHGWHVIPFGMVCHVISHVGGHDMSCGMGYHVISDCILLDVP
jgi:hypothetical protein